jgi:6-pyruvoyltetrahydropterin/6-carboxytetrahydropterin synthase
VPTYRIAKRFTFDAGHRLAKHPELCRFPHGHTYRVEVVLRADSLDANDMVCDYQILKTVVRGELERLDHAMIVSGDDPARDAFAPFAERVVVLEDGDPTAEVIVRHLYRALATALRPGTGVSSPGGPVYRLPERVRLESVRLWETPTSWAEYSEVQGTGQEEQGTGDRGPGTGK